MTRAHYKMLGGVPISTTQALWYRTSAGGAWTKATLSDYATAPLPGVLYPQGDDESSDLILTYMEALVGSLGYNAGVGWTTPSAYDGKLTFSKNIANPDPGWDYLEISCYEDGDSANVTDNTAEAWGVLFPELYSAGIYVLALSGTGLVTWDATRPVGFSLWPSRTLVVDAVHRGYRAAQSVADSGKCRTVFVGRTIEYVYRVRVTGANPRDTSWNEYHQLDEFLEWASNGYPVMIYHDRKGVMGGENGTTAPYDRLTDSYGWVRGVLDLNGADWKPEPESGNYYGIWTKDLRFHAVYGRNY